MWEKKNSEHNFGRTLVNCAKIQILKYKTEKCLNFTIL